ncbi:extracellular solute-binding protein [Gryllotalpicola reticulitermitis]|uniref:Extracellular solute-binding protein n=1 Tax=Gryllotalpicola reticulitermitis TaxID=1184153 RepID=A0ABV8Q8C3_9MICO
MKKPTLLSTPHSAIRLAAAAATIALIGTALAACSSGGSGSASTSKVTITIGDRPPSSQKAAQKLYDSEVTAFEKKYPDITLKPTETIWNTTTFQALVAGGNLPDVLQVPFTEPQKLIANGQIADITEALKKTGLDAKLNPATLKIGQDAKGNTYGIPTSAYAVGLVYNRSLFTKAGLDPNKPPTTWDEVRADAKIIKDKTGTPGFGQLASQNFGGWMFTGATYSYGGSLENAKGTKATFDAEPAKQALANLQAMRWTDDSVDHNALYNYDTINKAFASGSFAMFVAPPSWYSMAVTTDGMSPSDYGAGPMPQANGTNATLTGGNVQIVNPKATEPEKEAAVKWINFYYLTQYTDQSAAVAAAKAGAASNNPVGLPDITVVGKDEYNQYEKWIKPYVNVPLSNFAPFATASAKLKDLAEPTNQAQQVYASLDTVIQTVLTNKNANIDKLLSTASANVDSLLSR